MSNVNPNPECPVCRRPTKKFSRYCNRHALRLRRYGDPKGNAMRKGMFDVQLAVAQRYVQLHSETKGMQSARELARMMLNYRAATPLNTDLQLQDALRQQREAGAEPLDLIARMLAFLLFLEGRPGAFGGSQRAEDVACGRFVTHAVPRADKRYTAHVYALAGALAREHLGPFAVTLLRKVNADAARVATLRRESMELEA